MTLVKKDDKSKKLSYFTAHTYNSLIKQVQHAIQRNRCRFTTKIYEDQPDNVYTKHERHTENNSSQGLSLRALSLSYEA